MAAVPCALELYYPTSDTHSTIAPLLYLIFKHNNTFYLPKNFFISDSCSLVLMYRRRPQPWFVQKVIDINAFIILTFLQKMIQKSAHVANITKPFIFENNLPCLLNSYFHHHSSSEWLSNIHQNKDKHSTKKETN